MKKIILLAMLFILSVVVLGGCSNSSDTLSAEEKEIIDAYDKQIEEANAEVEEQRAQWQKMCKELEESSTLEGDKNIIIKYGLIVNNDETIKELNQEQIDELVKLSLDAFEQNSSTSAELLEAQKQEELANLREKEQFVTAVQNSYFEGHTQNTIGEYFDLYEQKALAPLGEELNWTLVNVTDEIKADLNDVNFNAEKEKLVMCMYNSQGSQTDITATVAFLFAYDTSNNNTKVIKVILETTDNRNMICTTPDEISTMVDTIVNVAER